MDGGSTGYRHSSLSFNLLVHNSGKDNAINTAPIDTGFISCMVGNDTVFLSDPMPSSNFRIDANTSIQFPILVSNIATANL
jgi:hypothetical protein